MDTSSNQTAILEDLEKESNKGTGFNQIGYRTSESLRMGKLIQELLADIELMGINTIIKE